MKKHFLIFVLAMLPIFAMAVAVEIDGIYYNLTPYNNNKVAKVASNPNKYSGSVVIPQKVTYAGTEYNVTSIGDNAFGGCSGLTSITIPNSVTNIGGNAFRDCDGLTSVTIPNSVTNIGGNAFRDCDGLTSFTIPNSVTNIGESAFSGCTCLTSISVGNGNTVYDSRNDCNAIIETESNALISGCKNTIIPNSVTSIMNRAFEDCFGLTSITIPNSVTNIGDYVFWQCSGLTSVTISNSVTKIGHYVFYGCTGLTSVTIPNSVTYIEFHAFFGCSGLTSITIPNSVTYIGQDAFYGCSGLTSISVGNGNRVYDSRNDCNAIIETRSNTLILGCKSSIIPNSVTGIGNSAFSSCSGLTSITIPNSVTSIGGYAFGGCSGLTSITIPNSVTYIGQGAFYNCSGLTSISVGNGNTVYDSRNDCNAIIEKESNTLISGCKNTIIPNSVTSIGYRAFEGCSGLISITIPNSVTSIGEYAFRDCDGLTSVTIPNSVKSIEIAAFTDCSGLTSVTIGNSVTSIGDYAFQLCSGLSSVTIGNSISSIGRQAFESCPEIKDVYCYAEKVPTTDFKVFEVPCIEYATLHVPSSAVNAYKATAPWNEFKEIIALKQDLPDNAEQCATPTITYQNGKLSFASETEGVEFNYVITDNDIKAGANAEVQLDVTYHISVYATKEGYKDSETATATLCWIDANPTTEGITQGIASVSANAVLIRSNNGILSITGAPEGTSINVYDMSGKAMGSAKASAETTNVATSLHRGDVGIVKIGEKSIKFLVK